MIAIVRGLHAGGKRLWKRKQLILADAKIDVRLA